MKRKMLMLAAGVAALSPAMVLANPGGAPAGGPHAGSMMSSPSPMSQSPTATPMGPTNGAGYNHTNAPAHATGQQNLECGEDGPTPGHASTAPGSAFNEDGKAGTKYAGEQPQNSRNTASVSQYDTACSHQPH
jgi:hypothetical protein